MKFWIAFEILFCLAYAKELNEAAIKKKYSFGKDRIETGENSVLVSGTIRGSKPRGLNTEKKVTMKLDPEDDYTLSHEIEVYEALIKKHDNLLKVHIVPMLDSGHFEKQRALIMPTLGENLDQYKEEIDYIYPFPRVRNITIQVFKAVIAMHDAGYTHCDIHAENVAFGLEKPPIEEEDRENDVTYDTDAYLFDMGEAVKFTDDVGKLLPIPIMPENARFSRINDIKAIGELLLELMGVNIMDHNFRDNPYPLTTENYMHLIQSYGKGRHSKKDLDTCEQFFLLLAELFDLKNFGQNFYKRPDYIRFMKIFEYEEEELQETSKKSKGDAPSSAHGKPSGDASSLDSKKGKASVSNKAPSSGKASSSSPGKSSGKASSTSPGKLSSDASSLGHGKSSHKKGDAPSSKKKDSKQAGKDNDKKAAESKQKKDKKAAKV